MTGESAVFKCDSKVFRSGGFQEIRIEGNDIVTPLFGRISPFDDGEYLYVILEDISEGGNSESAHIFIGQNCDYIGFIS